MEKIKKDSQKDKKEFDITKTGAKIDLPKEELEKILADYNKYIIEKESNNGGE